MFIKGKALHKRYICMIMAVVLVISAVFVVNFKTDAAGYRIGTVYGLVDSTLNFREGPGTNYKAIAWLNNGQNGEILDEGKAANGATWYKMNVGGVIGWAHSDYIKVTVYSSDDDFETYLTKQGFPESYKEPLRKLHAMYPNWEFEAQHTGLTWDEVIEAESEFGRSLISKSSISSWKSLEGYDWTKGDWIGLDGGSWTAASKEIIKYYVDPRNFLDHVYVFQFLKQSYDSTIDYAPGLTTLFSKSEFWRTPFEEGGVSKTYVQTLVDVGKVEGVSPFTIASTLIQEKGWNPLAESGRIMVDGSRGVYNYYNAGAFEGVVNGVHMTPSERGVWYAKQTDASTLRPWTTRTLAIQGGTKNYAKNYIGVGQDTIYLKKFDVVPQGGLYWHQYMTNIQAAASEGKLLADAFWTDAMIEWTTNSNLKFKIPVYTNMPSTASPRPTGDGSPNYMLKSLLVEGYNLTPNFNMYDTAYDLIVPHNVESVKVLATAYDANAKITGAGVCKLATGTNKVTVNVKAPNGNTRTYTISIVRQNPPTGITEPSVASSTYKLNSDTKVVTGVKETTSVENFLKGFTITDGTAKVVNADGSARTGYVGTGSKLVVYDKASQLKLTYEVILYGDANGDGKINARDLLAIQKNNINVAILKGAHAIAADVNRDGKINARDLLRVQKHNIKVQLITQ